MGWVENGSQTHRQMEAISSHVGGAPHKTGPQSHTQPRCCSCLCLFKGAGREGGGGPSELGPQPPPGTWVTGLSRAWAGGGQQGPLGLLAFSCLGPLKWGFL